MSTTPSPPLETPAHAAANDVAAQPHPLQWVEIVQQIGGEIAGPLSAALEQIQNLSETGQIDRRGLRALRQSVDEARQAGMLAQQLARLASGRLKLARDRVHLAQMLRSVLAQRSRETQSRGIQVRQALKPIEIWADGALLFSLLNALMDWALACTQSSVDLKLELTPWPAKARLSCRFAHRNLDLLRGPKDADPATPLDSLAWRLLEQTAITMGVLPLREQEVGITVLTLEFPQPALDDPAPVPEPEPEQRQSGPNSKALAGCHLLLLIESGELRARVQTAVQHMGLLIDAVSTVPEAVEFCEQGLPHALIFDASLMNEGLLHLIAEISQDVQGFSFIELHQEDHVTQLSTATPDSLARISAQHLLDTLPSMLMFELGRRR